MHQDASHLNWHRLPAICAAYDLAPLMGNFCMKHITEAGRPKLVVIMTKHVDDLKLAGTKAEVTSVLQQIEKVFGKAED